MIGLIGHTGFVGSNLKKSIDFESLKEMKFSFKRQN